MTLIAPPSWMAALNVGRNVSRSTRIDTFTGPQLVPGLGLAVRGVVLERRDQVLLVPEGGIALEPAHGRDAKARHEIRVFAERLFDAAPSRVARHVHDGRQRLVGAARTRFGGGHRVEALDQVRDRTSRRGRWAAGSSCPRARRGRAGTPRGRSPESARRDSSRRRTSGWRSSVRPSARAVRPPPASLARPTCPRPWPSANACAALASSKLPCSSTSVVGFCCHTQRHLRDLLLERHAREQVRGALVRRPFRVAIGQTSIRCVHRFSFRTPATALNAGFGWPCRSKSSG